MTVLINIGRRVPRNWFKRRAQGITGLISFQENIWLIIKQSMSMAKRKATHSGKITFVMTSDEEVEDMNYKLDWIKIIIQGTPEQEKEEYDEANQMYSALGKVLKKELPDDVNMKKHFKTKVLPGFKVEEAYKKGFGSLCDDSISNKLLELGILTHTELIEDYDSRQVFIPQK
jgi:hypothetical protein